MPPPGTDRAEAMARRISRTAARLGVDRDGEDRLRLAFDLGMTRRRALGLPDHHPDFLHPSRTALILMDDTGLAEVPVLAAALVVETRDPRLVVPADEMEGLGRETTLVACVVPDPAEGERLLETLLAAPREARLVALAERLDHARHLHLRDPGEWADYHALTCEAYAPVAARTHSSLESRLTWWCAAFRRRFLQE